MKNSIITTLRTIENEQRIKIVYAVESGSRGWGFASRDSDYDVRFIYVHPIDWYLSIEKKRDVIEYPVAERLDINGWDIRKALILFQKSNPPLYEWLTSPIIYLERGTFAQRLRELMPIVYAPISSLHHYLHMAKGNYREYLKREKVRVKKYFYVLRPVLACLWIERHNTAPPMEFKTLLHAQEFDKKFVYEIENLLMRKKAGEELDVENKIGIVNNFLEEKIEYFEQYAKTQKSNKQNHDEVLDILFRDILREQWRLQVV